MIKEAIKSLIETIEKRDIIRYAVLGIIFLVLVGVLFMIRGGTTGFITGFAVFQDDIEGDFNNGSYVNTTYNGSAVVLVSDNLTGSYTSQVFDAGGESKWNNISWEEDKSSVYELYTVDGNADIWKSVNNGINWSLIKDDYTGAESNGATYMGSNSSGSLFILYSQDVWKSDDYGVTWNKVNDDINPGASNNGQVMAIDSNDYIYIIDGADKVLKSENSGINFSSVNDSFGEGPNAGAMVVDNNNDIFVIDNSANVWKSSDEGVTWNKINDDYNGGIGNDVTDMYVNSSGTLFVLHNQDVWHSIDSGVNWVLVNDDYNGGDSNLGQVIHLDSNNYIYIADGSEDIYQSTDSGVSFVRKAEDMNGGNGNIFGLTSLVVNTNLDFQVRSCNDAVCSGESWTDITDTSPQDLSLDNNTYFQYKIIFSTPDSSITPELYNVTIDYDLLNTAPSISLVVPQQGASYGYNESLELNFSVSDDNLDSCWYNIDDGSNTSLAGCANTTFDVSKNGNYVVNIYANDSLGEESSDSANFSVQVGAPTIVLSFPIDEYLNYQENINFNYTPTDMDLDSCELWGDFNESFSLNQTEISPENNSVNTFYLNLSDGIYLWNIQCNDSLGNSAVNGNQTFYIDTVNPSISVSEPSGEKTSRTVSAVWSVSDNNLDSCWYNVYQGASLEIVNTSVTCLDNTTSFDVSSDSDFVFYFYINDSAGNQNTTNSSFSVDTSSSTPNLPSGGGSGGGGGGGGYFPSNTSGRMQVTQMGEIIAHEGDEKSLSLNVKNIGNKFLNNCRLIAKGDISSWVYLDQIEGIAPGENIDFNFNLNVPDEIGAGDYSGDLEIKCDEGINTQVVVVTIPGVGGIEIKDIIQEKEELDVNYILNDDSLVGKEVNIEIWLVDRDGVEIKRITDNFVVEKGENKRSVLIQLPKNLAGIYSIYFAFSSDLEGFVRKSVVLGKSRTVGQVVLDGVKGKMSVYVIFLLIVGAAVFFIWKRHKEDSPHVNKNKNKWLLKKKGFFKR